MIEENKNTEIQENKPKRKWYRRFELMWFVAGGLLSVLAFLILSFICGLGMDTGSSCMNWVIGFIFYFLLIIWICLGFFIILLRLLVRKRINIFIFLIFLLLDLLFLNYYTGLPQKLLYRLPKNELPCIFLRSQLRDRCYFDVFERNGKKDMALCDKINSKDISFSCYSDAIPQQNAEEYKNLDILSPCKDILATEKKDECIKNIAVERDDIDLCGLLPISETGITSECYRGIIFNGRRTDEGLCKKQYKDYGNAWLDLPLKACIFEVAVNNDDLNACKQGGPYTSSWWCYAGIAIKRNDPTICKMFSGSVYDSADCLTDLALKKDNLEYCKEREYEFEREECISSIAIQRNDEKLCDTLSRLDSRVNCLTGIAVKRGDLEMCKIVPEESGVFSHRDNCIIQIAIEKNDPKICDYITAKFSLDVCYKKFGIKK
jgi:hypothetical protein